MDRLYQVTRGFLFLGWILVTSQIINCSKDAPVAGGTSEETNAFSATITDESGAPITGVKVTLRPAGYLALASDSSSILLTIKDGITDNLGSISMDSLTPGEYRLEFNSGDTAGAIRELNIDSSNTNTEIGDVALSSMATVEGKVDLPEGVEAAYIQFYGLERLVVSDSQGNYHATLPEGDFELVATDDSGNVIIREIRDLVFDSGESKVINLSLIWTYSKKIFFNTTPNGADVSENQLDFPLWISLDSSMVDFPHLIVNKLALGFSKSDSTPLPYEIVRWDESKHVAEIWVRIDTVLGNQDTQFIYLHTYGGIGKSPMASFPIFDSSNGYLGVYHLNDNSKLTSSTIQDVSRNNNRAIFSGSKNTNSGIMGVTEGALVLNGSSEYITTHKSFNSPQIFNLSLWFRTSSNQGGKLIGFGDNQQDTSEVFDRHVWIDTNGYLHFGIRSPSTADPFSPGQFVFTISDSSKKYNDNQWYQVVAEKQGTDLRLYVNGALASSGNSSLQARSYIGHWRIGFDNMDVGWDPRPRSFYYQGALDEVHLSSQSRSSDWIKLAYENLRPGGLLISPSLKNAFDQGSPPDTSALASLPNYYISQRVIIHSSQVSLSDSLVEEVPVLIRIPGNNPLFEMSTDGMDIRATGSNGSPLNIHVEYWSAADTTAHVWVYLDTVILGESNPNFSLYIPRQSEPVDRVIFSKDQTYSWSWDMSYTSLPTEINESTESENEGYLQGSLPPQIVTAFGKGFQFNGTDNWMATHERIPAIKRFSMALWVKTNSSEGGKLISFSDSMLVLTEDLHDRMIWLDTNGLAHFGINISGIGTGHRMLSNTRSLNDGQWHYLAATVGPDGMRFYVDGVMVDEDVAVTHESFTKNYNGYWRLGHITKINTGWTHQPKSEFFSGTMEDVRILSGIITEDWIKLNWLLHNPESNIIQVNP